MDDQVELIIISSDFINESSSENYLEHFVNTLEIIPPKAAPRPQLEIRSIRN